MSAHGPHSQQGQVPHDSEISTTGLLALALQVPIVLADFSAPFPDEQHRKLRSGRLADIAPTILELLQVSQPEQMTGMYSNYPPSLLTFMYSSTIQTPHAK